MANIWLKAKDIEFKSNNIGSYGMKEAIVTLWFNGLR